MIPSVSPRSFPHRRDSAVLEVRTRDESFQKFAGGADADTGFSVVKRCGCAGRLPGGCVN